MWECKKDGYKKKGFLGMQSDSLSSLFLTDAFI